MAVKGQAAKQVITEMILKTFEDSFLNGKEIRIPVMEGGEVIEIKVTLTAAKDILGTVSSDVEEPMKAPETVSQDLVEKYAELLAKF